MLINTPVLCTFDLVTATLDKVTIAHWSLPYKIHLQATVKSAPLPLTLIYATLGFYVPLVAKHYLSLYAHMRLYFTHKMTEKRYLSAKYHFMRYLFSPYNRHHNTLFADKSGDYNSKIITHLPIIGARTRTLQCEMDGSLYVSRHSPRFATALPFTLPDNFFYLLYLHLLALLSTKHNADNGIRTHMVK